MKKEYDKYKDVKYWKNLINTLKAIPVKDSQRTAMKEAITAVGKNIPIEPVREDWEPNRCPTCFGDLGGENLGDGYYENPFFERCPRCGQKLKY